MIARKERNRMRAMQGVLWPILNAHERARDDGDRLLRDFRLAPVTYRPPAGTAEAGEQRAARVREIQARRIERAATGQS